MGEVKAQAPRKWVEAVNADRTHGRWAYVLAKRPAEVKQIIADAVSNRRHYLVTTLLRQESAEILTVPHPRSEKCCAASPDRERHSGRGCRTGKQIESHLVNPLESRETEVRFRWLRSPDSTTRR